jgi:[ribosomal protein S5]-alanine N-acetyltransferase
LNYALHNQETRRLLFREIRRSDFSEWLEFFKDPTSYQYWIQETESPERECEKWYAKQFDRYQNNLGGMNALIEKETGELVGHCGVLVQQVDGKTELEIAYSLLGTFRSRGYATEAVIKCRDYAFENRFAESLISIISVTNTPSARVAMKAGMTISKQTIYKSNAVNIFCVHHSPEFPIPLST